jgi:hypothetical protein
MSQAFKTGPTPPPKMPAMNDADTAARLLERAAEANNALLCGDIEGYLTHIRHTQDFTLMSPFGGKPSRGFNGSAEGKASLRRFFRGGSSELELVSAYTSETLIVLAIIEHQRVAVAELPEQDWSLRVTLVYRLEGGEWRLAHRHADPLVRGVSVEQSAALARG